MATRRMYAVGEALSREMATHASEIELRGGGGEPVDLPRTIASHGVADLPPNRIDEDAWTLELTLPIDGRPPRAVRVSPGRRGFAKVEVLGRAPGKGERRRLTAAPSASERGASGSRYERTFTMR